MMEADLRKESNCQYWSHISSVKKLGSIQRNVFQSQFER